MAKGVESLQGRVTAAQSWPLFQKRKKYLRQCSETPRGRNFDFPEMMFKIYIKMFSQEDFALNSKLRPGGFLLHLPIFTGNSRSTGIDQLWARKTRSKRARCHFSPVCSPMYNGVFTFSCQSQYFSSFLSWRPQKFGLQIFPKWGDADFFRWKRRFLVWALYYVHVVVEVTMNMAKYGSRRSQQPENVKFEPIIRGLKSDIFDWDQV